MKPEPAHTPSFNAADEAAIRAIHNKMIAAWNAGDATAFIAPFTNDADFVAFEGTHLKGRGSMMLFHQQIFDTVVKGSRLMGEVKFIRSVSPVQAVMHSVVAYAPAGQTQALPSRDSMQLMFVSKCDGEWRVEALMNARRVTLERQLFLDDIDLLSPEAQQEINDLIASLKARHG